MSQQQDESAKVTENDTTRYYVKRIFAAIIAPLFLWFFSMAIVSTITLSVGGLNWAKNVIKGLSFADHPLLAIFVILLAFFGLFYIIPNAAGWLNSSTTVPFPGFSFMPNPLFSEEYKARHPFPNTKVALKNYESVSNKAKQLEEISIKMNALHQKTATTILNINRLQQSLNRMVGEETIVHETNLFLNDVASEICTSVMDGESNKSCSIMLVRENSLFIAGYARVRSESRRDNRFPKGSGFAGTVWRNGQPDICNDVEKDGRFNGKPNRAYKSIIGVPIYDMGNIIGIICVQDSKKDAFVEDDIVLIQSYTEVINLFLTIYSKYEEFRMRALESSTQVEVAATTEGGGD